MRILFTTYAARPHLYPMVPLAWSCLAAGHEVRMVSTPSLQEAIAGTGLPSACVGEDIDAESWYRSGTFVPRPAEPGEPEINRWMRVTDQLAAKQFSVCEAMVDGLVDFARAWQPDLIVHDPVTFAGPVAGQVLGIPTVSNLYGMARLLRLEVPDWVGTEFRDSYSELFDRWGVEPRFFPSAWVDPCPPGLRWPGQRDIDRIQTRYLPYNGPGAEPGWLLEPASRPRVCVTWGTSQQKKLGVEVIELFGRVAASVAELGVEVVLTVGAMDPEHRAHLGSLPDNVRLVDWLPLSALVSRCQAVVHTGGTGVLMTSACYGVPQLGITKIPEGRFNSERLAAVGAGIDLPQDLADATAIRDSAAALLEQPAFTDRADDLRREIDRQPLPATVVPALEEIVLKARVG